MVSVLVVVAVDVWRLFPPKWLFLLLLFFSLFYESLSCSIQFFILVLLFSFFTSSRTVILSFLYWTGSLLYYCFVSANSSSIFPSSLCKFSSSFFRSSLFGTSHLSSSLFFRCSLLLHGFLSSLPVFRPSSSSQLIHLADVIFVWWTRVWSGCFYISCICILHVSSFVCARTSNIGGRV